MRNLRTQLDLPFVLFLISALVGVWASYDPTASWRKFVLIVIAIGVYYLLLFLRVVPRLLTAVVWGFLLASAAVAIYFVTQNDFASQPAKFEPIAAIGMYVNGISPQLSSYQPHPNIVAGVLEIALPLNVALIASKSLVTGRKWQVIPLLVSLSTCLLIVFSLLMTSSRGAWLALGVVAVVGVFIVVGKDTAKRYALPLGIIFMLVALVAVARFETTLFATLDQLFGAIPVSGRAVERVELYRQGWRLIQDYYFTGSGLGVFPMILSTYALLLNVPFLTHIHNWFLQVWLEQGLLGFFAFAWIILEFYLWVWKRRSVLNWLAMGGVAATTVMLLHGLLDVLLYSSRALPLMFVPMGLAVASGQSTVNTIAPEAKRSGGEQLSVNSEQSTVNSHRSQVTDHPAKGTRFALGFKNAPVTIGLVLLFTVYGLLLTASWQPVAAQWYANLGSVAETRVELASYRFPDVLVEYTRRDPNLANAEEFFAQALSLDPGNVTANQRLAAIALARGEYELARRNLERAYQRDPSNPVTWQLLGDAYLALGQQDAAYAFWSRIDDAETKLQIEAGVRYDKIGDRQRAGWARAMAERIGVAR